MRTPKQIERVLTALTFRLPEIARKRSLPMLMCIAVTTLLLSVASMFGQGVSSPTSNLWIMRTGSYSDSGVAINDSSPRFPNAAMMTETLRSLPALDSSTGEAALGSGFQGNLSQRTQEQSSAPTRGVTVDENSVGRDDDMGRDYALIITGNNYTFWPPLANPSKDGDTLRNELVQNYHFGRVDVVSNPTKKDVRTALDVFRQMKPEKGDRLLIYIAGHGFYDSMWDMGYLVLKESRLPSDDADHDTYLNYSEIRDYVDRLPFEHILLVLDVCYGGSFNSRAKPTHLDSSSVDNPAPLAELVRRKMEVRSRYYITSGGVRDSVLDGEPGKHSPFARAFLRTLRQYGGSEHLVDIGGIVGQIDALTPEPYSGSFGTAKEGGDFVLIPVPDPKKTDDPSLESGR